MKLWDPYSSQENPYAMYDRLREVAPVYQTQTGDFVLTGYKEIRSVLFDDTTFRVGNRYEWISRQVVYLENKEENLTAIVEAMNSFLVQMNGADHAMIRSLVVDAWDNHEVEYMIRENIDELLNSIRGNRFDLIKDFASPLPVMTMARIMGMPKEDYRKLKAISADLLLCLDMYTSFKALVKINSAATEFISYIQKYLEFRMKNRGPDLVSKIIQLAQERSIELEERQLISICIFLFMAGEETTINLIGTGFYNCSNLNLPSGSIFTSDALDAVLNEALRYDSPVQLVGRVANHDTVINGTPIPKESTLTLSLGAANRDPAIFPTPSQFDITRNPKNHLAFGAGTHFCLGSWLAKIQWKLALTQLYSHFPTISVDGTPTWSPMLSIRGLASLPVKF